MNTNAALPVLAAASNLVIQQMLCSPTVTSSQCSRWISDRNECVWILDGSLIRLGGLSCLISCQLDCVKMTQKICRPWPFWWLMKASEGWYWSILHKQDRHWLLIAAFSWSWLFSSIMVQVWLSRKLEIIRVPNKTQNSLSAVFKKSWKWRSSKGVGNIWGKQSDVTKSLLRFQFAEVIKEKPLQVFVWSHGAFG